MEIELAGTNVSIEVLKEVLKYLPEEIREKYESKLTPEIISAAYARISRSEKSVDELVKDAIEDTKATRESVTAILGMGHQSIADHALFNFNIKGVSRLLIEKIEERRLGGYTEKSQRYVTLDGDYVKPKEFSKQDLKKFEELVAFQNKFYFENNKKLLNYLKKQFPKKTKKNLEGKAKEDARYSLSLATEAQLGCSYTGQTAELSIRKLRHGRLKEEKELSNLLYNSIVKIAPSLIQLSNPELFKKFNGGKELQEDNFKYTRKNLQELVEKTFKENKKSIETLKKFSVKSVYLQIIYENEVTLLQDSNPDRRIITALLYQNSKKSLPDCSITASQLSNKKKEEFVKKALKYISGFDKVPREFETSALVYEFPLSASCFAQLKRHRMNTLLAQDYNPELGYTIPESIREIGATQELKEVCDKSSEIYYEFLPKYGKAAEYCLTNAHKRGVIIATNIRQLYHISRTREDQHAQWEIRDKANKMAKLAKQVAPATTILLGGKSEFGQIIKEVYENGI